MGRGRAKAKQTKVARELKYNSPNMDLDRLRADLGGDQSDHDRDQDEAYDGDEFADDEDSDEWSTSR
jgi:Protein of unknown function (DUF3073)